MSRNVLEPEPYVFDSDFERLVVALACGRASFWMKVGREIDPECMPTEEAKIVMREAKLLVKETSKPPAAPAVQQRLVSRSSDGRLTQAVLARCIAFMKLVITPSQDLEDNIVAELLPVLRRRFEQQVLFAAADESAKGAGFEKTKDLISRTDQLGSTAAVEDTDEGIDLLSDAGFAFDEMELLKNLDRMPLGIPRLDIQLGGGFWRGCCALLIAATGNGKSITMGHVACTAIRQGRSVALASLEDNRPLYNARLTANLIGWEWEEVLARPKEAKAEILKLGLKTRLRVKYFDPDATPLGQVIEWAEREPFELLVVDYVDKVKAREKTDSGYVRGLDVMQDMRKYAERENKWLITASQARRKQDRKRLLDNDDVADSMHKVRVPQLVVTLNYDELSDEVTYVVSKNRMGKGRFEIGPEPHDWARGRAVPLDSWQGTTTKKACLDA